jgi:hypothetical protein
MRKPRERSMRMSVLDVHINTHCNKYMDLRKDLDYISDRCVFLLANRVCVCVSEWMNYYRRSVGQSVLVSSPIWGSGPDINYYLTVTVFFSMSGAPSDENWGGPFYFWSRSLGLNLFNNDMQLAYVRGQAYLWMVNFEGHLRKRFELFWNDLIYHDKHHSLSPEIWSRHLHNTR